LVFPFILDLVDQLAVIEIEIKIPYLIKSTRYLLVFKDGNYFGKSRNIRAALLLKL